MSKLHYAQSALIFALLALIVLAITGDTVNRGLVVLAAILAAWSQFAVQDGRRFAQVASIVAVYLALLVALIGAVRLIFGIP